MSKSNKLSFCTVCMNRLHHIKQTLPANINSNKEYENLEFILLDYNSSDGTEEWVKDKMAEYIDSGKLIYYKTTEPSFFNRSHSRNMAFKLATGDIICNIDADNYTGQNFAEFVNTQFNKDEDIYLVADTLRRYYFLRNAFGRFCVWKNDLIDLGGLDEKMISYGSETLDLYERLKMLGRKEQIIENVKFLDAISHGDEERINNEFFMKNLKMFLLSYVSHEESEVIFLFHDNTYEKATLVIEKIQTHLPAAIKDQTIVKGTFHLKEQNIALENEILIHKMDEKLFYSNYDHKYYYHITDLNFLLEVAKNYSFIMNNHLTVNNNNEKKIKVNDENFGKGNVFKNFEVNAPVSIF